MEGNRRSSLRSQQLLNPIKPKAIQKPFPQAIKDDFSSLITHFTEYKPSYISTPFEGSCFKLINNDRNFVFASEDGRVANCDIDKKQLVLHHQIDPSMKILSIEIPKNMDYLFIGTESGVIYKFRFDTFEPKGYYERHSGKVIGLFLSDNEEKLYSAGDTQVISWNVSDSTKNNVLYTHEAQILSFDLSNDFVHLASGDNSGVFKVFNTLKSTEQYSSVKTGYKITAIKISSKNTYLILGTDSAGVIVLNFGDWSVAKSFNEPKQIHSVNINLSESFLVTGNASGTIKVWNLEEWQDEVSIQAHSAPVQSMIISRDVKSVYSIGTDKRITISKLPEFETHFKVKSESTFVSFLPNFKNDAIYGLSDNGHIIEFKRKAQERIAKIARQVLSWNVISNGLEIGVILVPIDSKLLEVNIIPLKRPITITPVKFETESRATAAVFAWEGEVIIIGQAFKVTVIHVKNQFVSHTFRTHSGVVSCLATEKNFAFAGDDTGIIKWYNYGLKNEDLGQFVDESHSKVTLIRPLVEERLLFSANENGEVIVWSLERKVSINKIMLHHAVKEIYFTRDKVNFMICSGESLTIWSLEDLSREAILSLQLDIESFMLSCDESYLIFGLKDYIKMMENPLKTEKLGIYGNYEKMEMYVKYVVKIISGEFPKHDESMDDWLIEPFHINTLHLYAYFDMPKHLEKSIQKGGSFFNSRAGYSPLTISLDKKSHDCIDAIYESLKLRSFTDKMALHKLSSALPELNRFSYSKLQDLYSICYNYSFAFEMPKFIEDSESLPKVIKSKRYFVPQSKFCDNNKFSFDEVAVEFKQSFVKINTKIGSEQSLNFMKSLVQCQNSSIYTTAFIQVILNDKWKTVSWILGFEVFLYFVYLLIACYMIQYNKDQTEVSIPLIVAFVINVFLYLYELLQIAASGLFYFKNFWNWVDTLRFLTFTSYSALLYIENTSFALQYLFISAVILSLLRGASYFRIISSVRWVIKLLFDVVSELWALSLIVLYTGIVSFEFYKFLEKENIDELLPISKDYFRIQYSTVIFVVLINPLIVLNLYLAIIGEKLEKSENEKVILDGQELAEMIYEAEILFFWNRKYAKPKFVHVLQEEAPEVQAQRTSSQRIKNLSKSVSSTAKVCAKTDSDLLSLISIIRDQTENFKESADKVIEYLKGG